MWSWGGEILLYIWKIIFIFFYLQIDIWTYTAGLPASVIFTAKYFPHSRTKIVTRLEEHSPISMAFFYPILVRSTPPRTICRVMRGEVRLSWKVAQKIGGLAPHLLSLCTSDLDYTLHNATNSSRGIWFWTRYN